VVQSSKTKGKKQRTRSGLQGDQRRKLIQQAKYQSAPKANKILKDEDLNTELVFIFVYEAIRSLFSLSILYNISILELH